MNTQRTSGGSVTEGLPARYRLIDKDGRADSRTFESATQLAEWAHHLWPDQEQDEDRSGKGWDIEEVVQ